MSQDVKNKTLVEGVPGFDWDAHTKDCPTVTRKHNPNIKTKNGDRVFSREPYAQEMYNTIQGILETYDHVFNVEAGETHNGKVHSVDIEWATIEIGHKELIYVNMAKESDVAKSKLIPGEEISVKIIDDKKQKGFIIGSVEAGMKAAVLKDILASIETEDAAYPGTVTGMIPNGGYFVNIQGIDCFMPGSLAGINKLVDFGSIVGTELYVVPMSYSADRGTVIVSHRKYLQAMIPAKLEELKNNIGITKNGNVTGSAKYGVFVEFDDCLTGMIHANDLTPDMADKHRARQIMPGDPIEFKVKEIISDKKITLTQLEVVETVDPWQEIAGKYTSFPVEVAGLIKSVKDYGVFVDIGDGIVGLLHVSELPEGTNPNDLSRNEGISVQITRIDTETRKVFLKL